MDAEPFQAATPDPDLVTRLGARLLAQESGFDLRVLHAVIAGPKRYHELRPLLEGRRDHNLTVSLGRLQEEALLDRITDVSREPPVHAYAATPYGHAVAAAAERMKLAAVPSRGVAQPPARCAVYLWGPGTGRTQGIVEALAASLDGRKCDVHVDWYSALRPAPRPHRSWREFIDTELDAEYDCSFWVLPTLPEEWAPGEASVLPDLAAHLRHRPDHLSRHFLLIHVDILNHQRVRRQLIPDEPVPFPIIFWREQDDAVNAVVQLSANFDRIVGNPWPNLPARLQGRLPEPDQRA